MNRFRLVCIGIVMVIIIAIMGSCSKVKAGTVKKSYYNVEYLNSNMGLRLYRVTIDGNVNYVLRSNNGGLCVLN